jgi:hypothetical protein
MPSDHSPEPAAGLSRRQVLVRGAVAAGVVWAAPVIRSTAAYATTNNGTEQPCNRFFFVTINPAGKCHRPGASRIGGNGVTNIDDLRALVRAGGNLPPAIVQWLEDHPRVKLEFPAVCPQLTQASDQAWALLLPAVTGPNADGRQCRMVIGWGRKGNDFAEAYVDPNPPLNTEVGRRLIFPKPERTHGENPRESEAESVHASDGSPTGGGGPSSRPTSTTTTTTTTTTRPSGESLTADDLSAGGDLSGGEVGGGGVSRSTTPTSRPLASRSRAEELGGGTVGGGGSTVPADGGEQELTVDGRPSTSTFGPGRTLDEAVLIFCCPE